MKTKMWIATKLERLACWIYTHDVSMRYEEGKKIRRCRRCLFTEMASPGEQDWKFVHYGAHAPVEE